MTAFNIIKTMARKGNVVIGSGCYAAAISSKNKNTIIKVGNNIYDPWLDFYRLVIQPNFNNPHLPTVHKLHVDYSNGYYVAVVDTLEPMVFFTEQAYAYTVCKRFLEGYIDEQEFVDNASTFVNAIPNVELMLQTLINIKSYVDYSSIEAVPEEESLDGLRLLDLHTGNVMVRSSGELVFNDPWRDADMEDIVDVADWVERVKI